jgi:hypothetical protein
MATKKPGADRASEQRRIVREIAKLGYALPGTLTVRAYRCGKANCRCHADPTAMHGPYNYWSRKVGSVTKTRVLTDEQLEDYREWLDNARRLKALTAELHELALAIVDEDTRGLRADRKRRITTESAPKRGSQRTSR